ncbi:MAG: glutamate--tRNA ligase [Alphaproteobacteria bacterium]|nr:glutamate--tRNA ligase [Alphaproteobacteria bacterium]MDE2110198.1 glutamate--tRNA ligase [Alphaproteobacteria bacterium]
MTTVRFAPSPTGLLHVGNARTALLNFLFAKKNGGKFLLRIDDTDSERSKPEYETAIVEDLGWLGIAHDLFARQSERTDAHRVAAEKLKASGRLYPCYETQLELDRRRQRQIAAGRPPVYDRAALKLTGEDRAKLEAQGRRPHWRFKLSQSKVRWRDLIRGEVEIDTAHLSDPVLIREDGRFLYTLPSVTDDVDFAVTQIIRGEDHVTNTAAQIEIFEALGATAPAFAHHPLLVGAGGEALSKRLGSLSLRLLREDGIEPMSAVSYLAKTGTSDAVAAHASLDELVAEFAVEKIGRAPAHFDPAELSNLNAKLLHGLPFEAVAARLASAGIDGGAAFWDAVKPNLARFSDVSDLWTLVKGPLAPIIENAPLIAKAAELLPPEPWDEATWSAWTKAVAAATGAKGRDLYHPLRLALTGREHGPELKKLLPLIGRARSLARLQRETA